MYNCEDFYSLVVLSLYEGELLGKVDKLYFDRKMKKLCCVELVGDDGAKLMLQTKNIYNVGKNAITVKNNQAVSFSLIENEMACAPIGSKVYSIKGEYFGSVKEIEFDDKFLTQNIIMDNGQQLSVKDITSIGKKVVVFSKEDKTTKLSPKNKPKIFKNKIVQIAKTLPEINLIEQESNKEVTIQNSDFLLGRICTKDIFNFNNEVLIKAHSLVNKKNLKEINKFGKLRELMLYSK